MAPFYTCAATLHDILFQFLIDSNVVYYSKSGKPVYDGKQIRRRYFGTPSLFLLDFIAQFPLDIFAPLAPSGKTSL